MKLSTTIGIGERRPFAMIDRRPVVYAVSTLIILKPSIIQTLRIFIQKHKAIRSAQTSRKICISQEYLVIATNAVA